jgi:hypothetical protein
MWKHVAREEWRGWQDSNPRPLGFEPSIAEQGSMKSTTYGRPPIVEVSRSVYRWPDKSRRSRAEIGEHEARPADRDWLLSTKADILLPKPLHHA